MTDTYVIITAGGTGTRLNRSVPKQFLKIGEKPILWYTLVQFHQVLSPEKIYVTLPEAYLGYWQRLCDDEGFTIPHEVISGGQERFYSVKQALDQIPDKSGLVSIQDGVRPLASEQLIQRVWKAAQKHKAAIPTISVRDSLRKLRDEGWMPTDRTLYQKVQTPQVFDLAGLKKAYETAWDESLTDDAMVWEKAGGKVTLVAGEEKNFKITNEWDLDLAAFLLQNKDLK